jgi:hypothetical protein
MGLFWRRSKKVGPFRLTATKRGLGISSGAGPLRVSRSARGRRSWSIRLPFGLRYRGKG